MDKEVEEPMGEDGDGYHEGGSLCARRHGEAVAGKGT